MDRVTPAQRSANMRAIRSTGMKPEMIVRKLAHSMGYRYRLHNQKLPGRPDMVFPSRRKVILVHGCFWHQHPDPACKRTRLPKTNQDYWVSKLQRNAMRDTKNVEDLQALGWNVLILWECEVSSLMPGDLSDRLRRFLDAPPG